MADARVAETSRQNTQIAITRAVQHAAEILPAPGRAEDFGAMLARLGEARLVLLGRATHGTSEFYRARAAIKVMAVRPARADSYEYAFRKTGIARCLTSWHGAGARELADTLRDSMLERALGVIYRPESEMMSHYFEAVLAEQFDAHVWFEETKAVTPLAAERPQGVPETYPFGL